MATAVETKLTGALRGAMDNLSRLLDLVGKPAWTTPALVSLGLLSSLAEAVGITLILVFLYTAMGEVEGAIAAGGLVGRVLQFLTGWIGGTSMLGLAILVLIVARAALALAYSLVSANISEGISERARNMVHRQYLSAPYAFVQRHEQAQLMEVLGTESWMVAQAYSAVTRLIINGCSILVFGILLVGISWKITLVALVGTLLISAALRRLSEPARRLGMESKLVHQDLGEHMLVTLHGLRAIRAYAQEDAHQQRFEASSAKARDTAMSLVRLSSWIGPATDVGYFGILCVIIAGAGWWGVEFVVTLAAVALLYRLQPHARELESRLLGLSQMQPQLQSLRVMLEPDKGYLLDGPREIAEIGQEIVFDDVSFSYAGGQQVLDRLSFRIPAGKTTALIGNSGAGKTTIVNLLLRLYEPVSGTIRVDGHKLDDLRRAAWLGLIGVAGQDVDLVEGTVADNLRMARHDAGEEEMRAAAQSAGVAEFVEGLPEGFDTWIGQEGMRFSGGQRQRIGLARALLRDPRFLILDEAMSALDQGLEDRIRHTIENRLAGRTLLVITHRLETLRDAAHAVWIDNGRVKAEGHPHDILRLVAGQSEIVSPLET